MVHDEMLNDLHSALKIEAAKRKINKKGLLAILNSHTTIGSMLCCIEDNCSEDLTSSGDSALVDIRQSASDLRAAMKRSSIEITGLDDKRDLTRTDIAEMRSVIALKRPIINVLWHCLHLLVVIDGVESNLTIAQLLKNDPQAQRSAENLWTAVRPHEAYNPKTTAVKDFREKACLPALAIESEKYNSVGLMRFMSTELTNMKRNGRKELMLPLFRKRQ